MGLPMIGCAQDRNGLTCPGISLIIKGSGKMMPANANKVLTYLGELSRDVALRLHLPWAENYILFLAAAFILYVLFVISRRMLRPVRTRFEEWLLRVRRSALERAKSDAERKAALRGIRKALAEGNHKAAADLYRAINDLPAAVKLYREAGDHASAARVYEDMEDYGNAALLYREDGNNSKAAENFLRARDYRSAAGMYEKGGFFQKAAELFEKVGDVAKSAELYEVCFAGEGLRFPAGSSGTRYALLSGRLFLQAGEPEKAVSVFVKAGLFGEAAVVYEGKREFLRAAECYVKAENLEKAAGCFREGGDTRRSNEILAALSYKKGNVREAAAYAEEAGDLLQASEMFVEAGEYRKAGALLLRKGYFSEAGEMFLKIADFRGAGEAFEKGGRYALAADAYRRGDDKSGKAKAAALYEKGEQYFEAGEIFMELGRTEEALRAFQKVEAGSARYSTAAVIIGRLFLEKGMIKLAVEKLLKAIGSEPVSRSNLEAHYYLGLCYEASGEREKARAVYENILAEDFSYRDVHQKLSEL